MDGWKFENEKKLWCRPLLILETKKKTNLKVFNYLHCGSVMRRSIKYVIGHIGYFVAHKMNFYFSDVHRSSLLMTL